MMNRVVDFGLFRLAVRDVPELMALSGVPQPAKHHPEIDTLVHIDLVVDQAIRLTSDPRVHFAALLHDLGKGLTSPEKLPSHPGHEEAGVHLVQAVCDRISEVPEEWVTLAKLVCEYHTHCHRCEEMTPRALRRFFNAVGAFSDPARFELFLLACEADSRGRTGLEDRDYPQPSYLRAARDAMAAKDAATSGMNDGKKRAMSEALTKRLEELPPSARLDIFGRFCQDCGETKVSCDCDKV